MTLGFFDVRDFGAAGDGSDATREIQHAMSTIAEAGAGVLFFSPGIYGFSSTLDFTGLTVLGAGRDDVTLRASPSLPSDSVGIVVDLGSRDVGASLKGITVDGSRATNARITGIRVVPSRIGTEAHLADVVVRGFRTDNSVGVLLSNVVQCKLVDCVLMANAVNLKMNGDAGNFPAVVSVVRTEIREALTQGIQILQGYDIVFEGCKIEANAQEGVYIAPAKGRNAQYIHFMNCWFEANYNRNTSQFGFRAIGTVGTVNLRMTHCYFNGSDSTERAIHLTAVSDYVLDDVAVFNRPGNIKLDGNGAGKILNWPQRSSGLLSRTVEDPGAQAESAEAEWITWAPTYTAGANMQFKNPVTRVARYKVLGKVLYVELTFRGEIGGTPSALINVSLPTGISVKSGVDVYAPATIFDSSIDVGYARLRDSSIGLTRLSGNFSAGSGRGGSFSAVVELA